MQSVYSITPANWAVYSMQIQSGYDTFLYKNDEKRQHYTTNCLKDTSDQLYTETDVSWLNTDFKLAGFYIMSALVGLFYVIVISTLIVSSYIQYENQSSQSF